MKKVKKSVINGDVDESLFGTLKKSSQQIKSCHKSKNNTSTVSATKLATLSKSQLPSHSILNPVDINTIHQSIHNDKPIQKISNTAYHTEKLQKAAEHRQVIESHEANRIKQIESSSDELLQQQQRNQLILQVAKTKLDNELDDVKTMNHMMNYAQIVSIRDAQILEKQQLHESQLLHDAMLDSHMESERVKHVEQLEQRELLRKQQQIQGAKVIQQQIAEREHERFVAAEQKRIESQQILAAQKEQETLDQQIKQQKIAAGKQLLHDVNVTNQLQLQLKQQRKQAELLEDQQIQQYLLNKQQRESELELQQKQLQAEKQYEITRLRQLQEKAQDRQSAIDEIRARRYQEEKQRIERESEQSELQRKQQIKLELQLAREQQYHEKQQILMEQAQLDKLQHHETMKHIRKLDELDSMKQSKLHELSMQHKLQLQSQIQQHDVNKQIARQQYVAEGNAIAQQIQSDRQYIEQLKQAKLNELEQAGVKDVYMHTLKNVKILDSKIF